MEPKEHVGDQKTENPEESQAVTVGDATPLESAPATPDPKKVDDASLTLEQRNIMNSPNIMAPTTGPSEEEIAERKRAEELAKLDELKPLVTETLIDNGKSMERKKRRPLVVTFGIVFLIVIAVIGGVYAYSDMQAKKHNKDINEPVIFYTDEVKVGVDSSFLQPFGAIKDSIANFENVTVSEFSAVYDGLNALSEEKVDMFIGPAYPSRIVELSPAETAEPAEEEAIEEKELGSTKFINDAIVFIVNRENELSGVSRNELESIYSGYIPAGATSRAELANLKVYYDGDEAIYRDFVAFGHSQPAAIPQEAQVADVVDAVVNDVNGIAMVRYSELTVDLMNAVKMLEVDESIPSIDTISYSTYPYTIEYRIYSYNLGEDSVAYAYRAALLENVSSMPGNYAFPYTNEVDAEESAEETEDSEDSEGAEGAGDEPVTE